MSRSCGQGSLLEAMIKMLGMTVMLTELHGWWTGLGRMDDGLDWAAWTMGRIDDGLDWAGWTEQDDDGLDCDSDGRDEGDSG